MPSRHLLLIIGNRQALIESNNWERLDRLKETCVEHKIPVLHRDSAGSEFAQAELEFEGGHDCVIVCGQASETEIVGACKSLRERSLEVIVAIDSFEATDGSSSRICEELESQLCQLSYTEAVINLLTGQTRFVYAYPKADVATSVVVFFEKSNRTLLVKRKFEPFKGCLGLPGGFLRPLLEDLPACAARELLEETGLDIHPSNLRLVSVRSNPNRDRRGHVIDHGYCVVIKADKEASALTSLSARDDAEEIALVPVALAMRLPLAADHGSLLADAARMSLTKSPATTMSRARRWLEEILISLAGAKPVPQMIAGGKQS